MTARAKDVVRRMDVDLGAAAQVVGLEIERRSRPIVAVADMAETGTAAVEIPRSRIPDGGC